MNDQEYTQWIIKDTAQQVMPAVIMYALALTAYWTLVA